MRNVSTLKGINMTDNNNSRATLSVAEQERNTKIIQGFINNDWTVIQECHKAVFEMVHKLVKNNSGDMDDARDLVLDCFKVFRKQCDKPDFVLTVKFTTYIYSVAYKLWLKQLRHRRGDALSYTVDLGGGASSDEEENDSQERLANLVMVHDTTEEAMSIQQLYQIVMNLINGLGEICKKVLLLYADDKSHKEIATLLDINENTSRKRIFDCKESLANNIRKSQYFKELMSHPNIQQFLSKYLKNKNNTPK